MKTMFVAMILFASAASLWAQGQVVEGSMEIQCNISAGLRMTPAEILAPSQSDWRSPRISSAPVQDSSLFQSSSFVLMSIDSFYSQQASASGNAQGFQTSSLTIQAVPEPSTFALGSLAFVLMAVARAIRKNCIVSLN
jgi:hypothetical protein